MSPLLNHNLVFLIFVCPILSCIYFWNVSQCTFLEWVPQSQSLWLQQSLVRCSVSHFPLSPNSWTTFPSFPCSSIQPCDQILATGKGQKWYVWHLQVEVIKNRYFFYIFALFFHLVDGNEDPVKGSVALDATATRQKEPLYLNGCVEQSLSLPCPPLLDCDNNKK